MSEQAFSAAQTFSVPRVLSVPGITCAHCVAAITDAVQDVAGVEDVDVDLATKTVRITGNAEEPRLRAAISDAGYDAA